MTSLQQAYFDLSLTLPMTDRSIKQRLDRGYDIVQSYGYTVMQKDAILWTVDKASTTLLEDSSVQYIVNTAERSCTCPDFPTARAGLCKHRFAVLLLTTMGCTSNNKTERVVS